MTTESIPTLATGAIAVVPADGAAAPGRRWSGVVAVLGTAMVSQSGAAVASSAIATIGAPAVVAVRQLVAAIVLIPIVRPNPRRLRRFELTIAMALGFATIVMNLGLYTAIDRLGLALAVTLEFLGPLGVALAGARRAREFVAAVLAAVGVVVLVHPGPSTDWLGIVSALLAALAWAAYILLNREIGNRLPGLQGAAMSATVGGVLSIPALAVFGVLGILQPVGIALAVVAGVLCSLVPMTADLFALRRVPAKLFGVLASANPVAAAVAAVVFLGQVPTLLKGVGIALIVVANILATVERPVQPSKTTLPS